MSSSVAQSTYISNALRSENRIADRPVKSSRHCEICGCSQFETVSQSDRYGQPLVTEICITCGVVSHQQIPDDTDSTQFYAHHYRQMYQGEQTPSPRRVMRAWRNGKRIFRQLRPFLDPVETVYEAGAGIGCTVKFFEQQGFSASGCEPGIGFQRFAEGELQADVQFASLYDLPAQPQYDLILLIHVLEHLNSPRKALAHLRSLLNPNGLIYIECPNLAAPFAARHRMFHEAHVYNFTPSSLRMVAGQCGFRVAHSFGGPDDPNLQVLLASDAVVRSIDRDNYSRTRRTLDGINIWRYHLRWNYLRRRLRKIGNYALEHLISGHYCRSLLNQCRRDDSEVRRERPLDCPPVIR